MTTFGSVLLVLALAVLSFALFQAYNCYAAKDSVEEGFAGAAHTHSWGYDGDEFAKYSSEHTPQVRGPDPANPELYTWQYHPQNTLVDNRFYLAPECTAAAGAHRMAPIVDGRVGKVNADPVRVINLQGAEGAYVYSSPASHTPLDHPTPEYTYSTPAEEEDPSVSH